MMGSNKIPGRRCLPLLGRNFRDLPLLTAPPRNRSSLEKAKVEAMFRGMTIDELIASVERAEQHAREQQGMKTDLHEYPAGRMEHQELVEVA